MKTVRISYDSPNEPTMCPIGYRGDHNAVMLQIIPPSGRLNADFYRLDWTFPDQNKHSSQDLYLENGALYFPVTSSLTALPGYVTMQLKAFCSENGEITMQAAAPNKVLVVAPSEEGGDIPPESMDPLAQAIVHAKNAAEKAENAREQLENQSWAIVDGSLVLEAPDSSSQNLGRVQGYSAYEVWQMAGNTGTEADYLAAIKGETGDTGPQGVPGGDITSAAELPTADGTDVQTCLDALTSVTDTFEHPQYAYFIVDKKKRAAMAIKKDGTAVFFADTEFKALKLEQLALGDNSFYHKIDPEYLYAVHDDAMNISELCLSPDGRVPAWVLKAWKDRMFSEPQTLKNIICWGDSLTTGQVAVGTSYRDVLQAHIDSGGFQYRVINGGVGGEGCMSIAARQGAVPILLNPFTLPASGAVAVTWQSVLDRSFGLLGQGAALINPCHLLLPNGSWEQGTLSKAGEEYFFTREKPGEEFRLNRPAMLKSFGALNYTSDIAVLWVGTNDRTWSAAEIIAVQEYMVDALGHNQYIVVGLTSKAYHSDIAEKNAKMHARWGRHFLDIRAYLLEYGLADAGITPTSEDTAAIAGGEIPPSLRIDSVHFNAAGYTVIGNQIYRKLREERLIKKESV